MEKIASFQIYASYSQFMVFDDSVRLPGLNWTEAHSRQGFIRSESSIGFGIPYEFGKSRVDVFLGAPPPLEAKCDRAFSVPFYAPTGRIVVSGPEEVPPDASQIFEVPLGHYKLTAAIRAVGEQEFDIGIFLEPTQIPVASSVVLVADEYMTANDVLVETGGVAGRH